MVVVASMSTTAKAAEFIANALYLADRTAGHVARLTDDCEVAATFDGNGALAGAADLAFGPNGHLFVARGDRIVELDGDGAVVRQFGPTSGIAGVDAIEFGPHGHVLVACATQDRVVEFDSSGVFVRQIGAGTELDDPRGLTIGPNGNLFVSSFATDRICEFAQSGELIRTFGGSSGLDGPGRLAFGPQGILFVASIESGRILGFDGADLVATIGDGSNLSGPLSLAFGPDSRMYVGESNTGKLYSFGSDHALAGEWDASPTQPHGLAFAPFRFNARLEGVLARSGEKKLESSEKVVLSIHPGSDHVMIRFGAAHPDVTLADVDPGSAIVWHGFVVEEGNGTKFRTAEGVQVSSPTAARGTSSIALRISGSLDVYGRFVMKKATGTLHRAAGDFVFSGEITTLSLLDD